MIDGWRMAFTFADGQKITNGWNAVFSQEGGQITVEGTSGTSRVAPDASVTFGLQATWKGRNRVPAAFVLNGVRCTTPY